MGGSPDAPKTTETLPDRSVGLALFAVAVVLFVAEFAVMRLLPLLGLSQGLLMDVVDSLLLTAIAIPALYLIGFRPQTLLRRSDLGSFTRLEKRTLLLLIGYVTLAFVTLSAHRLFISGQQSAATVINQAGRQRMLSQRLAKQAMFEALRLAHATQRDLRFSQHIKDGSRRFERTLRGLIEGDPDLGLPPCVTEEAADALRAAGAEWKTLADLLEHTSAPSNMGEAYAYYLALDEASDRVLVEMETAVHLLEVSYRGRSEAIARIQGLCVTGDGLIGMLLIASFVQMIQQRRRLHAGLVETGAHNRAIIDTALDGVIVMDASGRITDVNPQAERMFGWSREEAVGRLVSETIVPEGGRRAHIDGLHRYLATGEAKILETRVETHGLHRDGHEFPLELAIVPTRCGGQTMFSAFLRDLTERKRTERALRAAKEFAETANRAKSEFLANMSHEIRTPMTAILGFTDILHDSEANESEKLNAIDTVRRNGQHLLVLINDILDLSKMEAGKLEVERITCYPRRILRDVRDLLRVRAAEKELELRLEINGAIPDAMLSDPTRLRQALVNLVGNAVKFSEQSTVRIIAECEPEAEMLTIDVIDQGIGMTPEQIAGLFQPFSQADASMTRKFGGTGLGLTITKRIAEMLGGRVTVQSEIGRGSTFSLTVSTGPLDGVEMVSEFLDARTTRAERRGLASDGPDNTPVLRGRVLLVEDGPDNQRLISMFLMKAGADVTVAENGEEGVEQALKTMLGEGGPEPEEPFGLILMDIQMPVMDGYTATKTLRERGYSGQIVALTAHAMAGEARKCLDAGCDHYLGKPIDRERLIQEVAERMGKPSEHVAVTP